MRFWRNFVVLRLWFEKRETLQKNMSDVVKTPGHQI